MDYKNIWFNGKKLSKYNEFLAYNYDVLIYDYGDEGIEKIGFTSEFISDYLNPSVLKDDEVEAMINIIKSNNKRIIFSSGTDKEFEIINGKEKIKTNYELVSIGEVRNRIK